MRSLHVWAGLPLIALLSSAATQCARPREARPSDARVSVPAVGSTALVEPAPVKRAPTERERDIAWAKERWPEQTRGVEFESLAPKLAGWVAEGAEIRAFITMTEYECQPILLARPKGDGAESGVLQGRVVTDESVVNGERQRSTFSATPGHWLHLESGGMTESFDGREWTPVSGWGVGDGGSDLAVLSHVDAEIARWEGVGVRLHARCAGPFEPLACANGGTRSCNRCLEVSLELDTVRPNMLAPHYSPLPSISRGATCSEPCPTVTNDAIERFERSEAFADAWMLAPAEERPTPVPTLYRSEARCRRESPR